MRCPTWLLGLLLSGLFVGPAAAQDGGTGTLIMIVRDPAGRPLAGVTLQLAYDGDLALEALGSHTTDAAGTVTLPQARHGTYRVTFAGLAPDGRPFLPPERQNLGILEDGSGQPGGFGIRFAERQATILFVIDSVGGEPAAVPMFDLAPGPDAPPQPIDPLLAHASPAAPPLPNSSPAASGAAAGIGRSILVALLLALAGLLALGWWRSRRPPPTVRPDGHPAKGADDGRLD